MNGPIPFSDDQLRDMCKSYILGASLDAVSLEFGISKSAVSRRLKAAKVKMRPRGAPAGGYRCATKQRVMALLSEGKRPKEIAKILSVHVRTVYRRINA